jgi:hypothetical protein
MVLFFDSEKEARLIKKEIKDGHIIVDNKQFHVDTANPLLLKKRFGFSPLYILKWDSIAPSDIHIQESDLAEVKKGIVNNPRKAKLAPQAPTASYETKPFNPKFRKTDPSPELYRKMMGMKVLGNIIPTKSEVKGIWWLIMGIAIGAMVLYMLKMYGVF